MFGCASRISCVIFFVLCLQSTITYACVDHAFNRGLLINKINDDDYNVLPASSWNYDKSGADWKDTCATGKSQSPIAFQTKSTKTTSSKVKLNFGKVSDLLVYKTGYAIKAEWKSIKGGKTVIPTGSMWGAAAEGISTVPVKPIQFHVHSTCEHLVNGFMCPLELHLVTKVDNSTAKVPSRCNREPCYAVFGVMYEFNTNVYGGKEDPAISLLADNVPFRVGPEYARSVNTTFNLDSLFPSDKVYVNYPGSLTTPPCSEEINWHLFTSVKKGLTFKQLETLQNAVASSAVSRTLQCRAPGSTTPITKSSCATAYGSRTNNRAVQAKNGRTLYRSKASTA